MRKLALLAIFLALPVALSAQYSGNGVPNLTCGANIGNAAYHDSVNGANYTCQLFNGVWQWRVTPSVPGGIAGDSFAVDITQPPYNAKCDGHSDDSAAIQSAMNSGATAIALPVSSVTNQQQCNTASTLVWPNAQLTIYGNGSILDYTGTGTGIDLSGLAIGQAYINDLYLQLDGTGTPLGINASNWTVVLTDLTVYPGGSNVAGTAVLTGGDEDLIWNGGTSNLPINTPTSIVQFNHVEIGCTDPTRPGLYLDSNAPSAFDTLVIYGCTTAIKITDTLGLNLNPTYTFSGGWLNGNALTFDIDAGIAASISGSLTYDASAGALFSTPANFKGSLTTIDSHTGNTIQWGNGGVAASGFLYSAAGTPLPACGSATNKATGQVSDATTPTFLGTYVGSGAVKSPVLCNGANWVTY